jgi:glycosyltransferase involved in cell wall biosynthesis
MPVYNAVRFIDDAIASLRHQSLKDFEVVVVDDGSTDGTRERLIELATNEPRIHCFAQENGGISAARNRCISEARAPIIAWLDADDVADCGRLKKQLQYLESHGNCIALGSQFMTIDEDGKLLWPSKQPLDHSAIEEKLWHGSGSAILNSTLMTRRAAVLDAGGYDETLRTSEDLDLFLRLGEKGKLRNLTEYLVYYRRHPGGISAIGGGDASMIRRKKILAEASGRRGLEECSYKIGHYPQPPDLSSWYATTAELAYVARAKRKVVLKHALRALRLDPANRTAETALLNAVFGVKLTRLFAACLRGTGSARYVRKVARKLIKRER